MAKHKILRNYDITLLRDFGISKVVLLIRNIFNIIKSIYGYSNSFKRHHQALNYTGDWSENWDEDTKKYYIIDFKLVYRLL